MNRDPFNSNTLYFGSQFVHKSIDGGQTWRIISKDLQPIIQNIKNRRKWWTYDGRNWR